MSHKIRSRLGGNRITFAPYERDQLVTILKSRLEGLEVFGEGTVRFISASVAKITGDARRALDVCRRAIEVVESHNEKAIAAGKKGRLISIPDAQAVQKSMSLSGTGLWIDRATLHQKIMLFAISRELKKKGTEDVVFNAVSILLSYLTWPHQSGDQQPSQLSSAVKSQAGADTSTALCRVGLTRRAEVDHDRVITS